MNNQSRGRGRGAYNNRGGGYGNNYNTSRGGRGGFKKRGGDNYQKAKHNKSDSEDSEDLGSLYQVPDDVLGQISTDQEIRKKLESQRLQG
jgi:hypothetical protein